MIYPPNLRDYQSDKDDFRLEIPEFYNFGFDVIDGRAASADKEAFIYVSTSGEPIERHRYSDLSAASNRLANVLRSLGAAKGDFALLQIPRVPAFYQVLIGCIKAGVVAIPGTVLLTARDMAYRINKSRARIAIVTAEHADKVDQAAAECPTLEHRIVIGGDSGGGSGGEPGTVRPGWTSFEAACAEASPGLSRDDVEPSRAGDLMLAYFTSGTTAHPKMVPRHRSYALAHVITGHYWMDLRQSDVHWTLSDTGWAKAAWGMVFPPFLAGAATVLYDAPQGFDVDAHLRLVEKLGVTTFCAPPTVFRIFAQTDLSQYDLSPIRHTFSAGEPLNPEAIRVWHEATGAMPHDGYGQTETINIVANYPGVPIRPGSMGLPVPGVEVNIIDDGGNILPDGEVGHIAVRTGSDPAGGAVGDETGGDKTGDDETTGAAQDKPWPPGLFRGYYEDPEGTAKSFRNGWYYTGDTATRDADGYIWFVGRSDDIISSASYRISPFEVESALQEHPAVAESAVVAKPDSLRGEIVKAYVILAPGNEPSEALKTEIQDFVKQQTAPYKYPREIEFREALPKTISGKIRRTELRDEARAEAGGGSPP